VEKAREGGIEESGKEEEGIKKSENE